MYPAFKRSTLHYDFDRNLGRRMGRRQEITRLENTEDMVKLGFRKDFNPEERKGLSLPFPLPCQLARHSCDVTILPPLLTKLITNYFNGARI